jgi:uracil-DNA glycosylase
VVLDNAPSWQGKLASEFEQPYMLKLDMFLNAEKALGKGIYPDSLHWFHALEVTPLDNVKVVILGQDPYHQPNQAHGLCFSVLPGVKIPPSLANIYKELKSDLAIEPAQHGYLEQWAEQGVLLLNAVLTVEDSKANAHKGKGWETFTDNVISVVNEHCDNVVFMLWGAYAQKKGEKIDTVKHCVLKAPHPSPLSAHRGFLGCQHFSLANQYLEKHGRQPIRWTLSNQPEI